MDRTGAIGSQQPPSIPDYEVRTPYPKPLYEYELGLTSQKDDYSLSSMDDDINPPQELPHDSDASAAILYIRSLALLERASKLMYLPVERDSPVYDSLTPSSATSELSVPHNFNPSSAGASGDASMPFVSSVSPSSDIDDYLNYQNYAVDNMTVRQLAATSAGKSSMRCARLRTPKAYEKVRLALLRLEADLPPDHLTHWGTWNGTAESWINNNPTKESVTVVCDSAAKEAHNADVPARMRLDVPLRRVLVPSGEPRGRRRGAPSRPHHQVSLPSGELLGKPGQTDAQQLAADFDVFISIVYVPRSLLFDALTPRWFFISNVLIREVKRLQALGDAAAAADVEADFSVVVEALKVYGKRHDIANIQVKRAEMMRQATLDDMEFMKGDGYDDDHRGRVVVDGKMVD